MTNAPPQATFLKDYSAPPYRIRHADVDFALDATATRVRSVMQIVAQGAVPQDEKWQLENRAPTRELYRGLTERVLGTRLIVWPEAAVPELANDVQDYLKQVYAAGHEHGSDLLMGALRADGDDYYNSILALGDTVAFYDKRHLVPFAEYFPLQSIDLVRRSFGRARQFSPGDPRPPLPSIAGGAGVIVCNEAMFPEIAAQAVVAGAELLVNPANDSWFGSLKYSLQALDIVRLRAVEQRRFVVRTSTAGPSAIIDPSGRIIAQSGTFTREWLSGAVSPQRSLTPYARVGDLFAGASAVAALGAFVHAAWGSTRASETSDPRRADLV